MHGNWAAGMAILGALWCAPLAAVGQSPLDDCAEQFIGGVVSHAPTIGSSPPDQPFGNNTHLCYQDDGTSFFATEYWPDHFAPRWAAYRLDPANYGTNGCNTYTRAVANCYVSEDTWAGFQGCTQASDPFHTDHMLTGTVLVRSDFGATGHDRGHIAPRQAFGWNVCAAYQTFSMANMSPQRAYLNQDLWRYLEEQVLTWAIDEGPIYVVTGTTYRQFPHEHFEVYDPDESLDPDEIYPPFYTMRRAVAQHDVNFAGHGSGALLRPKRDATPANIRTKITRMRVPTGYFKVIYRPPVGSEPAHAIGFLVPHTFENLNLVYEQYENVTEPNVFWMFASMIELIEETADMTFPGIPDDLKDVWGDDFFFARDRRRNDLRGANCGRGTPAGVLPNSTGAQRLAACADDLN